MDSSRQQRQRSPADPHVQRARELGAGQLLMRALDPRGGTAQPFVLRRAATEVDGLPPGPVRRALGRVLEAVPPAPMPRPAGASTGTRDGADATNLDAAAPPLDAAAAALGIACYGGVLERHGLLEEAETAFRAAADLRPEDPALVLHAARAARKRGDTAAARVLYRRAASLTPEDSPVRRLSGIGEALLSPEPEAALTTALHQARRAGDREAAGVALEERAGLRRADGRRRAALRDHARAVARFTDPVDRVRLLGKAADLLLSSGDLAGAREALLAALDCAGKEERPQVVARLRSVARAQGDALGLRRWPAGPTPLVMLAPRAGGAPPPDSAAPYLARWRRRLEPRALTD